MFNETELQNLCAKYKIKYKVFHQTGIILLDSGLDEWLLKYRPNKEKPYCLLHKNKIRNKSKFHTQRHLRTLSQSLDCIASHKNILKTIYGSYTYKKKEYFLVKLIYVKNICRINILIVNKLELSKNNISCRILV